MSVLDAVSRAMRSGRVITPNEFPAIHREALATVDVRQLRAGEYLLRGEAAEALRGARFRSEAEQRSFYVSFLHQARDRVLGQLQASIAAMPVEDREASLSCFEVSGDRFTPAACFFSGGSGYGFRRGDAGASGFGSGLLRYLRDTLPAHAFLGLESRDETGFFEIQLLDGVMFDAESFRNAGLPSETRIHASALRLVYRANVCSESPALPDCR